MASLLYVPIKEWLEDALKSNAISQDEAVQFAFLQMIASACNKDVEAPKRLASAIDRINLQRMPTSETRQ